MRLARVATGALVGVVVLAGCSNKEPASETLPTPSTTAAEASRTFGPTNAPMPSAAQARTEAGFAEFTRYYIALVNRLDQDLDSTYLRQFSRNCDTCDRLSADADSDADKGYQYEGGKITLTASAPATVGESQAEIAFTVDQAAYSVLDQNGQSVPGLSGAAVSGLPAGMTGVWDKDHWLVTNLSFG